MFLRFWLWKRKKKPPFRTVFRSTHDVLYLQAGAGDGNRTHVTSLEGWSSTIELHPQVGAVDETRTRDLHLGKVALYQLSYYRITTRLHGY